MRLGPPSLAFFACGGVIRVLYTRGPGRWERFRGDRVMRSASPKICLLTARAPVELFVRLEQTAREQNTTISALLRRGAELAMRDAGEDREATA